MVPLNNMLKIEFKDSAQRDQWLVGEKLSLGSNKNNDIVLDGQGVAEHHAEILINDDRLILSSASGSCYVNGLPVDTGVELKPEDELRIGNRKLLLFDPKLRIEQQLGEIKNAEQSLDSHLDWYLVTEHSKLKDRDFHIRKTPSIIGRSSNCTMAIPSKLLSRKHAELTCKDGRLFIRDLNSANGCFVNGIRITSSELHRGDTLKLAKVTFTVAKQGSDPKLNTEQTALDNTMSG